jgi:hypothetical protein
MSLSYQPFAESPEVKLLQRELEMNVPERERVLNGVLAATFARAALSRCGGFARGGFLFAALALALRAFTGRCPLYRTLGLDQRHPPGTSSDPAHDRR